MKARPILFSGPMVRAIIDGRKTQTRRVVKPQPDNGVKEFTTQEVNAAWQEGFIPVKCSYGKIGDLLWVRECFNADWSPRNIIYKADGGSAKAAGYSAEPKWKPSIHMPRWASRITLEITDVHVERLQDISWHDARAEGCAGMGDEYYSAISFPEHCPAPKKEFCQLWQSINGEESWDANPWVWVIEFQAHRQNIDSYLKARAA